MSEAVIHTVTGEVAPSALGYADGHTHVWIDDVGAVTEAPFILDDADNIVRELNDFKAAGGNSLIDCMPVGCGRNAAALRRVSEATGVTIIASTGFHLRKYYPPGDTVFDMTTEAAQALFITELTQGTTEAPDVKAGFIKIACQATLDASPKHLVEAAVAASIETDAVVEVHTEKGADAEAIARFMLDGGMRPSKLVLCHMDKRPDAALHQALVGEGILLEYDTFVRPKYNPEHGVWQLLPAMLRDGFAGHLVLATDLADPAMWHHLGEGPGAVGFFTHIKARLQTASVDDTIIGQLMGGNIARVLAR